MELIERPAHWMAAEIAAGRLAPSEVMAAVLDRIDAVNPALNAIVSLRARDALMAEARAADGRQPAGPLHGLPMAVKDLVATAGIPTTLGSPLFADCVPEADDLLAARLKAAGGIAIGKTNVPEFGLGSHSTNPVFGVTRNPYDPSRTAGGSSGGAGAALAARMLPLADGSDMMGSLRNPAGWTNVYSLRPTHGLVPPEPQGELFLHPLSTDGPMARCPRDLALLLSVMAGPDPRVPVMRPVEDYAAALDGGIAGWRIGWLGQWGGAWRVEDGILETCEAALGDFEALGATVEPLAPPFSAGALWESWTVLRAFAIAGKLGPHWEDPDRREKLKPAAVWEIEKGRALNGRDIARAGAIRSDWYRRLAALFDDYDALVLPTAQVWPFPTDWDWPKKIAGVTMDTYHRWMEVVVPASLAGVPAVTVPAGFGAAGLPMGLQVFGPRGADARLLRLAEAYHQATDWPARRPPPL